jgi:hypothetical protein
MQAYELAELAALVAANGPVLIRGGREIPDSRLQAYWTASRCRFDRWATALGRLRSAAVTGPRQPGTIRGVVEEILSGEVLARVWAATLVAYDQRRGQSLMEPVVRSVLSGQLEARHRVLTLLVDVSSVGAGEAIRLNRLRRRTERWTDTLIGYLGVEHDVSQLASAPERARDFTEDVAWQRRQKGGRFVWPLMLASLRASFRRNLGAISPNPDLNAQIAQSILACFPPEVFNASGVFHSLWLTRISDLTGDAQGLVDSLLAPERPSPPPPALPAFQPQPGRRRWLGGQ